MLKELRESRGKKRRDKGVEQSTMSPTMKAERERCLSSFARVAASGVYSTCSHRHDDSCLLTFQTSISPHGNLKWGLSSYRNVLLV